MAIENTEYFSTQELAFQIAEVFGKLLGEVFADEP